MMIRMVNNEHGNDDDDYECGEKGEEETEVWEEWVDINIP